MPEIIDIKARSVLDEMKKSLGSIEEDTAKIKSFFEGDIEDRMEGKRTDKLKSKEEKEQTKTLKDIAKNVKPKKEKDKGLGWKKIIGLLGGIALLNIPLSMKKAIDVAKNAGKDIGKSLTETRGASAVAGGIGLTGGMAYGLKKAVLDKMLDRDVAKTATLNKTASTKLEKFHLEQETKRMKAIQGMNNAELRKWNQEEVKRKTTPREATKVLSGTVPGDRGPGRRAPRTFGRETIVPKTPTPIVKGQVIGDPTKGTAAVRVQASDAHLRTTTPKTPKQTVIQQLAKLKDPASKLWNTFKNHPYTKMTLGMSKGGLSLAAKALIPGVMLHELFRAAKDPNTQSLEHAFQLSAAKGVEWLTYNPLIEWEAQKRGIKGNLTQQDVMKAWNKNKKGLGTPIDKTKIEGRAAANPNPTPTPMEKTFKKFKETDIGKKVLAKEKQAQTGEVDKKTWNQTQVDLMKHEDFRGYAYNDSLGVPTIGYGFNLTKPHAEKLLKKAGIGLTVQQLISKKGAITKAQGLKLLNVDQGTAQKDAWHFMGGGGNFAQLDPKAQSVIWNMAFNMGRSRLMKFGGLQSALLAGNYQSAADEMLYRNPSKGDFTKTPYALQTKGRAQGLADQMRSIQSGTPNSSGKVLDSLNQSRVGSGGGGIGSGGTQVNIGGDTNMGQETVIPGPGVPNPKHGGLNPYNANPSFSYGFK